MAKNSTSKGSTSGPLEVWLNMGRVGVTCRVVFEDEHTVEMEVESPSLRGAQRDTGFYVAAGYRPVGRWQVEDGANGQETWRQFRPESAGFGSVVG